MAGQDPSERMLRLPDGQRTAPATAPLLRGRRHHRGRKCPPAGQPGCQARCARARPGLRPGRVPRLSHPIPGELEHRGMPGSQRAGSLTRELAVLSASPRDEVPRLFRRLREPAGLPGPHRDHIPMSIYLGGKQLKAPAVHPRLRNGDRRRAVSLRIGHNRLHLHRKWQGLPDLRLRHHARGRLTRAD
jgi:hypothetical protein